MSIEQAHTLQAGVESAAALEPRVVLRTLPSGDIAFAQAVNLVADGALLGHELRPDELQAILQLLYPRVTVLEQDALSRTGTTVLWYVYRDGHYPVNAATQRSARDA